MMMMISGQCFLNYNYLTYHQIQQLIREMISGQSFLNCSPPDPTTKFRNSEFWNELSAAFGGRFLVEGRVEMMMISGQCFSNDNYLTYKSNNLTDFDESHAITGNGSTTNMIEENSWNREISGRGSGRDDDDFGAMLFKRQLSYIHLENSGKLTILTYKSNNLTNFDELQFPETEVLQICLKKTGRFLVEGRVEMMMISG